jgi:hypothetical protein
MVPKNITDRKGEEVTEVYLNTSENKLYFLCHYYSNGKVSGKYCFCKSSTLSLHA